MKYPLSAMTLNKKECRHIMQPIFKSGHTKAGISITLHTEVVYGPRSLGGIALLDPFVIKVTGGISFLKEQYLKSDPSSPLLRANLATLLLELGRGGGILKNDYIENKQWLQIESWILEIWKFMSENQINISHLRIEVPK